MTVLYCCVASDADREDVDGRCVTHGIATRFPLVLAVFLPLVESIGSIGCICVDCVKESSTGVRHFTVRYCAPASESSHLDRETVAAQPGSTVSLPLRCDRLLFLREMILSALQFSSLVITISCFQSRVEFFDFGRALTTRSINLRFLVWLVWPSKISNTGDSSEGITC